MRPDQPDVSLHMPYFEECASQCAIILELGVGLGNGSARAFTRGLMRSIKPDKLYLSVDFDENNPEEKPDLPYWQIVYGPTEDPATVARARDILASRAPDLIYIDTTHTKEQMAAELKLWSPLASRGTLWVFHDSWMFNCYNSMVEAIEEFCVENPQWHYSEITRECHGLAKMEWVGV